MSLTEQLRSLISQTFAPIHYELINESAKHYGHLEGPSTETHFKALIVSTKFEGLSRVRRQQMVYALVSPFLEANGGTLHALAMTTVTPDEWATLKDQNLSH
jgi:stress-induced morphogen